MKNIIDVINDKDLILELELKAKPQEKEILIIDNRTKSIESLFSISIGVISFYFVTCFVNYIFLDNFSFEINILVISNAFMSLALMCSLYSFIPYLKNNIIYKMTNKKKSKKAISDIIYLDKNQIRENKKITNKIIRFENSLNKKEQEYYLESSKFFFQNKDTQFFLFNLYEKYLTCTDIKILDEERLKIIEDIKKSFDINYQKMLIIKIKETIDENNINKELYDLDESFNKMNSIKKDNNLHVENT